MLAVGWAVPVYGIRGYGSAGMARLGGTKDRGAKAKQSAYLCLRLVCSAQEAMQSRMKETLYPLPAARHVAQNDRSP